MADYIVCLVSVGSLRFSEDLVASYARWADAEGLKLACAILDGPESYNVKAFQGLEDLEARILVRRKGEQIAARFSPIGIDIYDWSVITEMVEYEKLRKLIYGTFAASGRFRRECLNETFRSLQPRFRALGILKKNHPSVRIAVNYLLEELALKVAIFESGCFVGEILPKRESDLSMAIYRGEYFACSPGRRKFRVVIHDGDSVRETVFTRVAGDDREAVLMRGQ